MSRDINNKFWDEELETLPREELEKRQLADLQEIVKFAYDHAPYYKRSFDEAGVKPEDIRTLKDIQKFPFINKTTQRDTQGVGSFLGELAAVPEEDVVFISTSSGSTGVPTMSPFTKKDFDEFQDTESRWFWQIGMRPNDRYVHALNFSLYVGGPDVIGAQNLGALCIWGGTLPSERLLFVLKTYQPTVIWTSPSYAWQLGEKALKSGIDPKKDLNIKKIIVAGELGGSIEATRKAIEDIWGAEVYDFYGLSDIFGACAAMCEAKDGLHIAENHILVETVDIHTGWYLLLLENTRVLLSVSAQAISDALIQQNAHAEELTEEYIFSAERTICLLFRLSMFSRAILKLLSVSIRVSQENILSAFLKRTLQTSMQLR